jgi:hypothetical protein
MPILVFLNKPFNTANNAPTSTMIVTLSKKANAIDAKTAPPIVPKNLAHALLRDRASS